ncbi:MAG: exo-alpha-sialidase, partial [Verrucomicrobiota bacterium]|nr:exo-alpha-sialidase [Verrucomicrobiota bacterium]
PLLTFQKAGTGVWSIDRLSFEEADPAFLSSATLSPVLSSSEGGTLHLKDPVVFHSAEGSTQLLYCSHPFSWASSNTGLATRSPRGGSFVIQTSNVLSRGPSWDVACVRVTERLALPKVVALADLPSVSLYFYDGAECLRPLEENPNASTRPRGYSCEELGGLAWGFDDEFPKIRRISTDFPCFLSPHASGCSRYVSSIFLGDGSLIAAWQQASPDGAQPLVGNSLSAMEVARILS